MSGTTIIIGLYGGVGAGKSTVARLFADHGAVVLDADEAVTAAYARDDVHRAVTDRFGESAFGPDGAPDRKRLADLTFSDPQARADLEAILHPVVRDEFERRIEQARADGVPAVVLDVPLLAASPLQELVDVGVFVDAPLAVREARVRESRGWDAGEVARRDAAQTPLDQKRALARHVVINDDDRDSDDLRRQVADVWSQLSLSLSETDPRSAPSTPAASASGPPPDADAAGET